MFPRIVIGVYNLQYARPWIWLTIAIADEAATSCIIVLFWIEPECLKHWNPLQNSWHVADNIIKYISINGTVCIFLNVSL